MFILCNYVCLTNYFGTILTFQLERTYFLYDSTNKMYKVLPYFIAKNIMELPLSVGCPLFVITTIFWMVGFTESNETYGKMLLAMILNANVAVGAGFMMSTFSRSIAEAASIAMLLIGPWMCFGGYFLTGNSYQLPIAWLQWTSPIRYTFECLAWAQWKGNGPLSPCD